MLRAGIIGSLVAVTLVGCGGKADPLVETIAQTIEGARMLNRAVGLSTAVYGISTISVIAPHEVIAESIRGRMKSETGTCATVGGTGATATLTTPAAGCTLASAGYVVGGTMSCTVKDGPPPFLQIGCALDLTADELALDGSFDIFTEQGNSFSFGAALDGERGDESGTRLVVSAPDIAAGVAAQAADVSAEVMAGATSFTMAGVKQSFSQCYPRDGAIEVAGGELSLTSTTPQTGTATFTTASGVKTVKLPTRAGCPAQ